METDPILGPSFFGREEILEVLQKRVQAFLKGYRQNVAFTGPKSIGKSSLVQHFLVNLSESSLITIYVEVIPEPFDYFAQKFMGALLTGYLKSEGQEVYWEFDTLINKSKRMVPKTLKKMRQIKKILHREEWDLAFKEILSLTQILQEESGKKILLALDNFDRLENLLLKNPFHEFSNALMLQKDTLYLVTASQIRRAQDIFRDKLSLLFGNFEVLEIKPFDFPACQSFLEKRLPGFQIPEPIKKFLVELTDGHPYFLEVLTERVCQLLPPNGEAILDDQILASALEMELYQRKGRLHQYFVALLQGSGKGRAFYAALKVLLAVALGCKKLPQISNYLHRKVDEVKKTLGKLLEEELVDKKGSFFTLRFPLFNFWLRLVYYRREFDFVGRHDLSVSAFRKDVIFLIHRRMEEEKKELTKRVEELFRRFQNDVVEVESKKIKCPHFTEVHFKPSNGRVFPVEAKAIGSRWICQVAYKKVTEEDVRSFIQDIQKLRRTVQRKIMITLQGIELNATLLAKEAKILLWRLKNFNELLDLYDRPKVIV